MLSFIKFPSLYVPKSLSGTCCAFERWNYTINEILKTYKNDGLQKENFTFSKGNSQRKCNVNNITIEVINYTKLIFHL